MTRIIRTTKRRRTPLLLMALFGLLLGVMIGGGGFSSAASTSPSVADYSQCVDGTNDGPPAPGDTNCPGGWINGILNATNSTYHENEVTPQRLVVDFPKAGAHS